MKAARGDPNIVQWLGKDFLVTGLRRATDETHPGNLHEGGNYKWALETLHKLKGKNVAEDVEHGRKPAE